MSALIPALELIKKAVEHRPSELADIRKSGKKIVAWIGYNVPEELIYACGHVPVRLCWGGDKKLAETGASYFSTQNCFFLCQSVGIFSENSNPYVSNLDALASDTTCLQLHRMSAILRGYFGQNIITIGMPKNTQLPESVPYFMGEIGNFVRQLEELGGRYSPESLAQSIGLYNRIRSLQRSLYDQLAAENPLISWWDIFTVMHAGFTLDRYEYCGMLENLVNELQQIPAGNSAVCIRPRVIIAGSSINPGDTKLIDIIHSLDVNVVGDFMWSGFASISSLDIKEPTLQGLADAYINRLSHAALPVMTVESDNRLSSLYELVRKNRADGVIYYSLRYCDPFSFKMHGTKQYLKQHGVSLMEAHSDYSGMDMESLRTRVEAFVEMLRI